MNAWQKLLGNNEAVPPTIVKVRAIDIKPYRYGVWCTIEDNPKPFVNEIVNRRWSEDGQHIWFMLDTHNFMKATPEEEVAVVETLTYKEGDYGYGYSPEFLANVDRQDAERMSVRPKPPPSEPDAAR